MGGFGKKGAQNGRKRAKPDVFWCFLGVLGSLTRHGDGGSNRRLPTNGGGAARTCTDGEAACGGGAGRAHVGRMHHICASLPDDFFLRRAGARRGRLGDATLPFGADALWVQAEGTTGDCRQTGGRRTDLHGRGGRLWRGSGAGPRWPHASRFAQVCRTIFFYAAPGRGAVASAMRPYLLALRRHGDGGSNRRLPTNGGTAARTKGVLWGDDFAVMISLLADSGGGR